MTPDEILVKELGMWYHDMTADQLAAIVRCMELYGEECALAVRVP